MKVMNPPILKGERVIVGGNLQPYALAIVANCVYHSAEARWCIVLEWPNTPGGTSYSRVYDTDEGKIWYRYRSAS